MRLTNIGHFTHDRVIGRPEVLRQLGNSALADDRPISPFRAGSLLLAADVLAFIIALAIVRTTIAVPPPTPPSIVPDRLLLLTENWHSWGLLLVGTGLLLTYWARGHYTERLPALVETWQIVSATVIAVVFANFAKVAVDGQPFNPWLMMMFPLAVPLQLLLRRVAKWTLARFGCWDLRTLLVGDVDNLDALAHAMSSERGLGYAIVRRAPLPSSSVADVEDFWSVSLELLGADFVVVAVGSGDDENEAHVIDSLTHARIPFAVAPRLSGFPVRGVSSHYFLSHDVVLILGRNNLARPFSRAVKATFDFVVAALALVALSPLLIAIALIVKADGGPALFAHQRIGAGGRRFPCLKFRTMVTDSQAVLEHLLATDLAAAAEWHATHKLRDDPRVTRIGRFLRQTSLDELPQLLNVLAGHMSLVGPRPIVDAEVARYERDISFYYAARPGVTGLWQVSGRSDTSYAQRVRLDVWYVKNWSLWHDMAILMKTVPAILMRRGAV